MVHHYLPSGTNHPGTHPGQARFLCPRGPVPARGEHAHVDIYGFETPANMRGSPLDVSRKAGKVTTVLSRQQEPYPVPDPYAEPPLAPFRGMLLKTRFIALWPLKRLKTG